jgi:hypothetical protein
MNTLRRLRQYLPKSPILLAVCLIVTTLAACFFLFPILGSAASAPASAGDLLRTALANAQDAGSYTVNIALSNSITPQDPFSVRTQEEWARVDIRGEIGGPDQARFAITPGRTSFAQLAPIAQELLVRDGVSYEWRPDSGVDRWSRVESGPSLVGLDSDNLSLLAAAKEFQLLDDATGLPGPDGQVMIYRRVSFKLAGPDLLRVLLGRQGALNPQTLREAQRNESGVSGSGELWVDSRALPARLILDLSWIRQAEIPYRVKVHTETDYTNFGRQFAASRFDPAVAPAAGEPVAELVVMNKVVSAMWLPLACGVLALLWLMWRVHKGSRRALQTLTVLLLTALLFPTLSGAAEGAGLGASSASAEESTEAMPSSEVGKMLRDIQVMRYAAQNDDGNPASSLDEFGDEDGDGLPNGYEVQYGTNPFTADTDFDTLNDFDELNGITCQGANQQIVIKSNPMNPDTNQDGMLDGDEFHKGRCGDSNLLGWMWDDDNDNDKVPDALDLSPFSFSSQQVLYEGGNWQSPNYTFETLDQNPGSETTTPYPFYVEMQIRPRELRSLQWAYKHVTWPEDNEAAIQNTDPVVHALKMIFQGIDYGTSGEVKLVPFLQATVQEKDLPTAKAMSAYGVGANQKEDAAGNPIYEDGQKLWDMTIPLMTVERGGQVYAFQAKMLHDRRAGNNNLTRYWKDVRLKWAAVADVLLLDQEGKPAASPNGGWGLWVYDEAYQLTGLQVSRQGGASMLMAAALPSNQPYDDGPITLLRGGLEARFLPGGITLADIKNRFDTPNSATIDERWGIPQEQQYRVIYDAQQNFKHLDEAVATTTMTTTKQLLDNEFGSEWSNLTPTFLYASEQRTSTVNLDETPPQDYLDITINTCLKPLVTSRTLKLQSYEWVIPSGDLFGHWQPMSLDDVLAKLESNYTASTPANDPFFEEHLVILKMAMTTWQLGVTSVYSIGQVVIVEPENQLTDTQLTQEFVNENGVIPKDFNWVVDMLLEVWGVGGPQAWLANKWTTVVEVFHDADHFFRGSYLDIGKKTPDSYIKVIPMGDPSGKEPPGPPAEPLDVKYLGYTETALKVLGMVATVIGNETFSTVVKILTKIVQIYRQVRVLIETIKAAADLGNKAANLAQSVGSIAKDLSSMAKAMAVVGLIFTVAIIWLAVLVQIGDLGPSIALTVVLRAIVETVLAVILFVVALIFPYGTIVAIAIGLIKLIEGLIGFQFDPVSLLLSWLFDVKAVQRSDLAGDPQFGELNLQPLEPGGGVVAGADFRVSLPATAKMRTLNDGAKSDLNKSYARLHVGRFADWPDAYPNISLPTKEVFNKYKDEAGSFYKDEFHAAEAHIIYYNLPTANLPASGWSLTAGHSESKGATQSVGAHWERTDSLLGWVDVSPASGINRRLVLDIAMDVRIRYDQCSNAGGCDAYLNDSTSPPAFPEFFFDILPGNLNSLWHWDATANYDYDGDGLTGYQDPVSKQVYGLDANLCPNLVGVNSWEEWDSDGDGLSDLFEKTHAGFNPCKADTDQDDIPDGRELIIGAFPNDKDTDDDGLSDGQEEPYDNGFGIKWPWTISLSQQYPGMPNPPAFPNPRMANFDSDYRNDKAEKDKLSSPTSFNAVPVGDPLSVGIGQNILLDGQQSIIIQSAAWVNSEAIAVDASLTLTMPMALSNTTSQAKLNPPVFVPYLNAGSLDPNMAGPLIYRWLLPPLSLNRYLHVTLKGIPGAAPDPAVIYAKLEYDEGAVHQVAFAQANLMVNGGGPVVTFTNVQGAAVISGLDGGEILRYAQNDSAGVSAPAAQLQVQSDGVVTISGVAEDPDRVSQVFVCATTGSTCPNDGWSSAMAVGGDLSTWSFNFSPPSEGSYSLWAYAIDAYGAAGLVTGPLVIGVDQSGPANFQLDQGETIYAQTSNLADRAPVVLFTGQMQEASSPYAAGAGSVGLIYDDTAESAPVNQPGQLNSAFTLAWTPPVWGEGSSVRTDQGYYEVMIGGADQAGNTAAPKTVRVVVDDTPPLVYGKPPQTQSGLNLSLSGLADDTGLLRNRTAAPPFVGRSSANSQTRFALSSNLGKIMMVGDLNGDAIDDAALLLPAVQAGAIAPFRAAIFFGRVGGLPAHLNADNADVTFQGELPIGANAVGPSAAAVGDVNGDGVDDLFLGDPAADNGKGRAYLVLGQRAGWSRTFDLSAAPWKLNVAGSVGFGAAVAGAGDVNGDGLSDLLVGALQSAGITGGNQNGGAWLYLGREQGAPDAPKATFSPPANATANPPSLAGLGDVDGDGLSDLLLAFPGAPVALVNGRTSDGWPASAILLNSQANALFSARGASQTVAAVGDVNGDALQDFVVGDPAAGTPTVFLVYGRRPERAWPVPPSALALATEADASWSGDRETRLGASLASLGDVDGDTLVDLLVGQPGHGAGPNRAGILLSSQTLRLLNQSFDSAAQMIPGAANSQFLGEYLSVGDLTGDHIMDLLLGAPGESAAYLLAGDFTPGGVAGINQVEIGFFGPVTDVNQPISATLPTAWIPASLANSNAAITPWNGSLILPAFGDYRLYARATDRAGNRSHDEQWYLGNVWIASVEKPFSGAVTLDAPVMAGQTGLTLAGSLNTNQATQHLRVYDGYAWHRLPPVQGLYRQASSLPHADLRSLALRAVGRDAFGNTLQAQRSLRLDTLAPTPGLSDNLPAAVWNTDASPVLSVTWPAPVDASGIAALRAVIDNAASTQPTTPAPGNQLLKTLDAAGVYYAHVTVQDGAGNQATSHGGPYLVNRSATPSVIFADGYLDIRGGEYPNGTLLGYDPYALWKPAALWGTWDAQKLYLGFPGNRWNEESRLVFYLDTQAGGLNSGLPDDPSHSLPFAADFALLVGGKSARGYELYQATSGWQAMGDPKSFVVREQDTEVVLDRAEMNANASLGLLVLAEDGAGAWAVLPAAARPNVEAQMTGPLALTEKMQWSSLGNGVAPNAGLKQILAPQVTIAPAWDNVVVPGRATAFRVVIHNPDVSPYTGATLEVQVDPKLALNRADGARCQSCPQGGNRWSMLVDVAAGGTQTVTVYTDVLGRDATGLAALRIEAWLGDSGLPASPQPKASAQYWLDHGAVPMKQAYGLSDIYVKPGSFVVDVFPNIDLTMLGRCSSQVEVNPGGSGWRPHCALGDCTAVGGTIDVNASQRLEVRTTGNNGRSSEPLVMNVIADATAPTTIVTPTAILSGNLAFVEGLAWDGFPTTRAPARVEVQINDGAFYPAILTKAQNRPVQAAEGGASDAAVTHWRLPLRLIWEDGKKVTVTARAVDEAGNIGKSVGPLEILLDSLGPQVTMEQTDSLLHGKVTDGSGVASLEISLNGGAIYIPLKIGSQGEWSFEQSRWPGEMSVDVAILRGRDIYGNASQLLAPYARALTVVAYSLYLPLIARNTAVEAATTSEPPSPAQPTEAITETIRISGTTQITNTTGLVQIGDAITGTVEITGTAGITGTIEMTQTTETIEMTIRDEAETMGDFPAAPVQVVFLPVITRPD